MGNITSRTLAVAMSTVLSLCVWCGVAFANEGADSFEGNPVASESPNVLAAQSQEGLSAQTGSSSSGLDNVAKPTIQELKALYKALPEQPSVSDGYWSEAPNVSAYKAGALSSGSLSFAQAYLNLIRRSANLSDVTFENTLNANASQGALILARLNEGLTHYPSTPSGVTDAQAAPGKYACSSSNLSYSWGYGNPLQTALQGQMNDSSESNISSVGHRRWLLHPATKTMGIGSALSESGSMFTAVRVFDQYDGEDSYGHISRDNSVSYDYVAWPASGAFLNDLFAPGTPWSVSLNTSRYSLPNASSVKVKIKRLSDGKVWNLDSADSAATTTGEYFCVENSGYGTPGCIIFNPGSANLGANEYTGSYAVEITGLKTTDGAETSISYQVDFDSAQIDLNKAGATISDIADATYTGNEIKPAVNVSCSGVKLVEGRDYTVSYSNNIFPGQASVIVTGAGDYKGEISKAFTIVSRRSSGSGDSTDSQQTDSGRVADSGGAGGTSINGADGRVSMHRLYNPNSGEHFYTADNVEAAGLAEIGWSDEGFGWTAPASSSTPVYRMYNPVAGEHHYTPGAEERDSLIAAGWNDEGTGWYSDDAKTVPLYRDYNPNAFANNHNYTANVEEHATLAMAGWIDEGIAWYGI